MSLTREEMGDIVRLAIGEALVPIQETLAALVADVAELKADVAVIKTDVAVLKAEMATVKHHIKVLAAKQNNSTKGRDDTLDAVPIPPGGIVVGDGAMPPTLAHLSVAGNENLPNGQRNTWNARKSKDLLLTFGEADSDSETDGEEFGPTARRRRIKLARFIGVTAAQLNSANIIL